MTSADFRLVGTWGVRALLGDRVLVIPGERLFPGDGYAFWAAAPSQWRWEGGEKVTEDERGWVVERILELAAASRVRLDIHAEPDEKEERPPWLPGKLTFRGSDTLEFEGSRGIVLIPGALRLIGMTPHFAVCDGTPWRRADGSELSGSEQEAIGLELASMAPGRRVVIAVD